MDKADTAALHIHLFFIALSPSGFFMQSDSPPLRRGDVGRRMTTATGSRYDPSGVNQFRGLNRRGAVFAWLRMPRFSGAACGSSRVKPNAQGTVSPGKQF